jgi:cysteine desulfurase
VLYLDHNAASPLRPQALEAMLPWLQRGAVNAGSQHRGGQAARAALEDARRSVARSMGGDARGWAFTAGATEACNLGLQGLVRPGGRPLLLGATEHPAVAATAAALASQGCAVETLPVDAQGVLDLGALDAALARHPGAVLALMLANNETGVLHPVQAAVKRAHRAGGLCFCDLSQAAGKLALDVAELGLDAAAASAQKFGGPQGSGLLWCRPGLGLAPVLFGGHQERGLRPGTEAVAQAVGLAAALGSAVAGLPAQTRAWEAAQQVLEAGLRRIHPRWQLHGAGASRVANTVCASLAGLDSDLLLLRLDQLGVQASAGAACASGSREPSPVLLAMGASPQAARSAVRFSLGPGQGEDEAHQALGRLAEAVAGFRQAGLLD